MLPNIIQTGLTWYYFNVLAIAYIIYMLLKIGLARAERATINQAESKTNQDNFIIKIVVFAALFGIIYFFLREYISDLEKFWNYIVESIKRLKDG